jgi:hypothetical protein
VVAGSDQMIEEEIIDEKKNFEPYVWNLFKYDGPVRFALISEKLHFKSVAVEFEITEKYLKSLYEHDLAEVEEILKCWSNADWVNVGNSLRPIKPDESPLMLQLGLDFDDDTLEATSIMSGALINQILPCMMLDMQQCSI